ncbi:ankyrin repeat domain-containing protein, partial [Endozoicomonas sp. ONNA2]|uniref:ankyrin repeat domain-containing protein n=1 Tax=Endozoicomonas sp. ONNA2 TaxID=2828741 RepID=UPI0021494E84
GHDKCLAKLLEIRGVEVNAAKKSGETALHLAVYKGNVVCLKQLIAKGAKVNASNKNGETALH